MVLSSHLIIFTRYPEPGRTKTRLIPKLGATGAANLQREMTEHTLHQVRKLQQHISVSVEIHFAGGSLESMGNWLGPDWIYRPQGEGDLGEKMVRSLAAAFTNHAQKAIIIGTDCPSLDSHILAIAFQSLDDFKIVLGPATDGGYYLIGSRCLHPELFANIAWGTAHVLGQTRTAIDKLQLPYTYLPELTDIDRPEDLSTWKDN